MHQPDLAASNVEWRQWGEADPFYGVASWPGRARTDNNPWTPEEFYALGESDWADFASRWSKYGAEFGRAVEIGCGAGRLTKHMAKDFEHVCGVDVSEGMLRVARQHVVGANIEFLLSDGVTLPLASESVDGVFSTHVFQHFESMILARRNFAEAARVLAPGGTVMIHLPMFALPRVLSRAQRVIDARQSLSAVRANIARRRGKPVMRMLEYSWSWLLRELPAVGLSDVEIALFSVASNDDPHPFVFARKPNPAR